MEIRITRNFHLTSVHFGFHQFLDPGFALSKGTSHVPEKQTNKQQQKVNILLTKKINSSTPTVGNFAFPKMRAAHF